MWFAVCIVIVLILIIVCTLQTEGFDTAQSTGAVTYSITKFPDGLQTVVDTLHGTNGEYVVLLHPSPITKDMWGPLLEYFQKLYSRGQQIPTLIAYDLRGHGTAWEPVSLKYVDHDPTNTAWSFKQMANDLAQVIADNVPADKKIVLVGYGFGGSVAQQYAIDNPDRIQELILLSSLVNPMPNVENHLDYMIQLLNEYPNLAFVPQSEQLYRNYLCAWFDINNPQICPENTGDKRDDSKTYTYQMAKDMFRRASTNTLLQTDKMLIGQNFASKWAAARVPFPVRIFTGTRDSLVTNEKEMAGYTVIKRQQPDTILDVVDGKHGYGMTNTRDIAAIVCPKCVLGS